MVNYQNGKIYKIISNTDSDKCYVGSTTKEYLSQRFAKHKTHYNQYKNKKCRKITSFDLFDEFGIENCSIVLLEDFPCNSKDQLHSRERIYIETLNCVNKFIPCRTFKEYYQDNKEVIDNKNKEYNKINKEKLKEYRQENIEIYKERDKKYYEENKETINTKRKEKYTCDCGSICRKSDRAAHKKSLKHQNFLLTLNN